ncbi:MULTISPECIES: SpoIIIAH-like family protein [unclassified Faecalibacterium]|uniref:SpoIIIAH-like family protein n=1 Tax=unclassified Faecalibacterium TaxID=2646395 RepID=UPI000B390B01|nr:MULTISPECIES: SpoIIIAH-like family protein [unclassified Faecalibacterium]OUN75282.1 stage III sporulation protein AH [Faecalibacterium sp. An58]OUQ40230.1 stage III sporulation protein AH [Faecalibacterium sp. An121]
MRNIAKNTRRATAVTLAAALAVACYLNWQYAQTDLDALSVETAASAASQSASSEPSGKARITDALPTEAEAASSVSKNYGEAQLVSVANDTGSQFFDEARLKREKAHDEALDTIQKTLKDSSLSEQEKADYTAQMTANLEDINAENEIETLIKAKGFADCLCFLQSGRADLTVMTSGEALTAAQVAQIRDIVMSKSNVTAQNITVVEVK